MVVRILAVDKRHICRHEVPRVLRDRRWEKSEAVEDNIADVERAQKRETSQSRQSPDLAEQRDALVDNTGVGLLLVVGVLEEVTTAGLEL